MTFRLLAVDLVEAIRDTILAAGELQGRARDKSLEAALARVQNRLSYGLISDVFDLAAAYAVAIARSQCFNDGNKQTAHQAMDVCLDLHDVHVSWDVEEVASIIVRAAQGHMGEPDLAEWLRVKAR